MAHPFSKLQTLTLDHLGLVAAIARDLGLVEKIDCRLPTTNRAKVSMGQRVLALVLNGLGFTQDRLYLVPRFFRGKPLDRLIGPGIEADDLNDDALGRLLDEIAAYGSTRLFGEVAYEVANEQGLAGRFGRLDSTSLTVYGEYARAQGKLRHGGEDIPWPAHGYSKDHRPDLKQLVLSLTLSGEAGLPMWFEMHSGNCSDKESFHQTRKRVEAFREQLKAAPAWIWVADSALYSVDKLLAEPDLPWLTRVPQTLAAVKALCQMPAEQLAWSEGEEGYRYAMLGCVHEGLRQRWCLVYTEAAKAREEHTLERRLDKQEKELTRDLAKVQQPLFAAVEEAKQALEPIRARSRLHTLTAQFEEVRRYPRRGRSKASTVAPVVGYRLAVQWQRDARALEPLYYALGRFVLGTNVLDQERLADAQMLSEYKQQSQVERGFRFLKDPWFIADAIFLKTPQRIEALMMVMTLSLMIYNLGQYRLRERLLAGKQTLPSQNGKPTSQPTLRWVFQLMERIHLVRCRLDEIGGKLYEYVTNLCSVRQSIIRLFGLHAQAIYDLRHDEADGLILS